MRYVIVGLLSNAFFYVIYVLISWSWLAPKIAMTITFILSVLSSFILNKKWTFQYIGNNGVTLIKFLLAMLLGYLLNYLALDIFTGIYQVPHQLVLACMIFLVAFLQFFLNKFWVFKH